MPSVSKKQILLIFALICILPGQIWAETPEELLAKLKSFDNVYRSNFTATGSRERLPSAFHPAKPKATIEWTLIMDGDRYAIIEKVVNLETPSKQYIENDGTRDFDQNPVSLILVEKTLYWCPEYNGSSSKLKYFKINENNIVEPVNDTIVGAVTIYSPEDPSQLLFFSRIFWPLGRGFSESIDSISNVSVNEDGLLECIAEGICFTTLGKWKLVVDPQAAYMVREAKFYQNDLEVTKYEVKTEGTKWEDGRCFPEKAYWSDRYGPNSEFRTIPTPCQSIKTSIDSDLLDNAENAIMGKYEIPTNVFDNRMPSKELVFVDKGNNYIPLDIYDFDPLDYSSLENVTSEKDSNTTIYKVEETQESDSIDHSENNINNSNAEKNSVLAQNNIKMLMVIIVSLLILITAFLFFLTKLRKD